MNKNFSDLVFLVSSSDRNNPAFGSAFAIYKTEASVFFVTCAHVINNVGADSILVGGQSASVIAIGNMEKEEDVAIVTANVEFVQSLLQLGGEGVKDMDCKISGFSKFLRQYEKKTISAKLTTKSELLDRNGTSGVSLWNLSIINDQLIEGYSGAPIVDVGERSIIGIVSHRTEEGKKGKGILIESIKSIWPQAPAEIWKTNLVTSEPLNSLLNEKIKEQKHSVTNIFVPQFLNDDDDKLPDILTPGISPKEFEKFYSSKFGHEFGADITRQFRDSISAVEKGDFQKYIDIGGQILVLGEKQPLMKSVGLYFQAEGFRLLADSEANPTMRQKLLVDALDKYYASIESDSNNARSWRGIGRIFELNGDFDQALANFQKAKGIILTQITANIPYKQKLDLIHEILRTTRHLVNCIIAMKETSSQNTWNHRYKIRELEGYILECQNLHYDYMGFFKTQKLWYQFEIFASLIFLSRAWGSIGNYNAMVDNLLHALKSRSKMFRSNRSLNEIEIRNLYWWLEVAKTVGNKDGFHEFIEGLDKLEVSLDRQDTSEVLSNIDNLIRSFLPLGGVLN